MALSRSWRSWLKRLGGVVQQPSRTGKRKIRSSAGGMALEYLEDRTLLSGSGLGGNPADYLQTPLSFEANVGQAAAPAQFLAHGGGYSLALDATQATLALASLPSRPQPGQSSPPAAAQAPTVLQMQLVGANAAAQGTGKELQASTSNYLVGNDPSQWHTDVANYGEVEYQNVYDGINVTYHGGSQGLLEYDFTVAPGADASQIQLQFTGASSVSVDSQGNLVLQTAAGNVVEQAPVVYQEINGARQAVSGQYVLEANGQVGISLGGYDHSQALVIDPVVSYTSLLGGSGSDGAWGIAVDSAGNTYVTGQTTSPTFLGNSNSASTDAFVVKLGPSGNVIYSTLVGGSSYNYGTGIAVDAGGNAYITGYTSSNDFPRQTGLNIATNGQDAFAVKLNAAGNQIDYATILGNAGYNFGQSIAVDASGNAYVVGDTSAPGFFNASDSAVSGTDGFFAKLDPTGKALTSSFQVLGYYTGTLPLGQVQDTEANGVAVDASGNVTIAGTTNVSTTTGTAVSGPYDAFALKMNSSGGALYSTLLGGNGIDTANAVAVDGSGNAYITGITHSTTFNISSSPTFSAVTGLGSTNAGGAYVTKLNSAGQGVYSTFLGTSGTSQSQNSYGEAIAVDGNGNAYVGGFTNDPTFGGQPNPDTYNNPFVGEVNAAGQVVHAALMGASGDSRAQGIAVDGVGNVYLSGSASAPTFNGLSLSGLSAGFVVKIGVPTTQVTAPGGTYNGSPHGATTVVAGNGGAVLAEDGSSPVDAGTISYSYYTLNSNGTLGTSLGSSAPSNAGSYAVIAHYTSDNNTYLNADSQPQDFTIQKAASTVAVSDAGGTYNGHSFGASATVNSASSLEGVSPTLTYYSGTYTLSNLPTSGGSTTAPTTVGAYTVVASFAGSTDYSSGTALANFSIAQASPTVAVSDAGGTYSGQTFGASATVNGSGSLEGVSPTLTYYSGTYTLNTLPASGGTSSAPSQAGSYTVVASFAGSTDYSSGTALANFSIGQAPATVSVTDNGGTYNGQSFGASATVNGASSLEGVSPTLTYYSGTYTLNNLPPSGGTSSAPSQAGSYTVVASYAGSTDYSSGTALAHFTIGQASSTVAVSNAGGTYNGQTFGASATVNGSSSVEGVTPTLTYYSGTYTLNNLPTSGGSTTAPTTVGAYTVVASFAGSTDYSSGTALANFTITQATPTVAVNDAGGTYNGQSFGASATVNSASSLEGVSPTLTYYSGTYTLSNLPPSGGSTTAPTTVGAYTVVASFAGSTDYSSGTALANFTIAQASPAVAVSDAGGTYNGQSFAASATVNGGSSLEGVTPTLTYYVGTYTASTLPSSGGTSVAPCQAGSYTVVASFAGSSDYTAGMAVASFTIAQATPTVTLSVAGGTYNGNAFGPTAVTVTGIAKDGTLASLGSPSLSYAYYSGSSASGSYVSVPPTQVGTYTVVAYYAGNTNYAGAVSGPVTFSITPAAPALGIAANGGTYNGSSFPASVTVTGVSGAAGNNLEGVTPTLTYYAGSSATGTALAGAPSNAGTYTVLASFAGSADYSSTSASSTYTIQQATPMVSVSDAGGIASGSPFGPTAATVTGVAQDGVIASLGSTSLSYTYYAGSSASGTPLTGPPTQVGTYTLVAHYAGSTNYTSADSQPVTFTISSPMSSANLSVTVAGGTYNGSGHGATTLVTGSGGVVLARDGSSPVDAGTISYSYYTLNSNGTLGISLGSTAPINAGSYAVIAHYTSDNSSYLSTDSVPVTFTIQKATPTVSVTDAGGTNTGNGFAPTAATVTGVAADGILATLGSPALSYTYYNGSSATGTGFSTAPSQVGTYTVVAHYAGSTNYNSASSAPVTFTIQQASAIITPATYLPVVILGTGSTTFSGTVGTPGLLTGATVSVTVNGVTQAAIVQSNGSYSTTFSIGSLGAGTYLVTYSLAGNPNVSSFTAYNQLLVTYGITTLYNQTTAQDAPMIPISLEITNLSGLDLSSKSIQVTGLTLTDANNNVYQIHSPGDPSAVFTYNAAKGDYILTLLTGPLGSGTFTLYFTVAGDPLPHSVQFVLTK